MLKISFGIFDVFIASVISQIGLHNFYFIRFVWESEL